MNPDKHGFEQEKTELTEKNGNGILTAEQRARSRVEATDFRPIPHMENN